MSGYATLAKAGGWVLLAAIVLFVAKYLVHSIHEDGRKIGWSECREEQKKKDDKLAAEQRKKDAVIKAEFDRQQTELMGALGNEKKRNEDIEKRYGVERDTNHGLFVSLRKLAEFHESGKAESPGTCDSSSDRRELSLQDAENIRKDYRDADRVVNQYETLRTICTPLLDIVKTQQR
jgi:hypothetical protein